MPESARRRRRILVDGKFQLGVSLQIIGYVYLYLVVFALLANFNAIRTVIFEGANEEKYVEAVSRLTIFVQVFVLPLVFTFLCMCLHGLLFSHRIAGPIYRFKESLKRVRSGDLAATVRIRDDDYFTDLCEEMNAVIERLRGDLSNFREASRELADQGEALAQSGHLPPDAQEKLLGIANASTRLRQLMDCYRLPEDPTPAGAAAPEPDLSASRA